MTMPADPHAVMRSPAYLRLLLLAAIIGAPIAAVAWGFLWLVDELQDWFFTDLPGDLGFDSVPAWWPLPLLALAGVLVGLTIRYLPGAGGKSPADGFTPGERPPSPIELPSIFLAALAGLSLGVVIGPEAPLIALGGGLGVCAVRLAARDAPPATETVVAAAGSFSAISTLLGSPLLGAFLLMEASGLAGASMGLVLVPGLVAAGIGSLIFVGLDSWTGLSTFSLVIPNLPAVGTPTVAEFGWAIAIGLAAAVLGAVIRRLALAVRPHVEPRHGAAHARGGCRHRRPGDRLRRGQRRGLVAGAVLRAVGAGPGARRRGRLLGGDAPAADPLQGPGVRPGAELLPGRSDLPGDVHRGGGRHRAVPRCRDSARSRVRPWASGR